MWLTRPVQYEYKQQVPRLLDKNFVIIITTAMEFSLAGSSPYTKTKTKLRGLSPHANYTDRAAAAGRRS